MALYPPRGVCSKVNRHDLDMIRVWKCKLTVNWPCYVFKKSQNHYSLLPSSGSARSICRAISRRMARHGGYCENQLNWTQITRKFESGVKCKNIFRRTLTRISISDETELSEWVLAACNRTGIDKYTFKHVPKNFPLLLYISLVSSMWWAVVLFCTAMPQYRLYVEEVKLVLRTS